MCNNKFQNLENAQTHASKPCGKIREVVTGTETVESESSIEFDCTKCKTFFKSPSDFYEHANKCAQIIEPLICDNCNIDLVSKAGLKKHIEKCQAKSTESSSEEACTNGPDCKFLKQNRCLYYHDVRNKQPWQKFSVGGRAGRRAGRGEGRSAGSSDSLGSRSSQNCSLPASRSSLASSCPDSGFSLARRTRSAETGRAVFIVEG